MKWLTSWFIDNPIAANLLMVMILAGGILSLDTLRIESFPQIPPTQLVIRVDYPGASARQVDEGITQRIESAISGVPGIDRINSQSFRELAEVRVRKTTGTDLKQLLDNIRNRIDSITELPAKSERPQITQDEFTNLATYVMVYGEVSPDVLQEAALKTEQALKRHSDISQVSNLGKRQPQLIIEPKPVQLRRYGVSIEALSAAVQQWSLDFPGGELKTARGNLVLRGDHTADNLPALKSLPILNTAQGSVLLGQIADVRRGFEQDDSLVRFQGQPAVALLISTSQKDHLFRVSEAVKQVIHSLKPVLPTAVKVDTLADMTPYIQEQLDLLGTNAWQGLLIVLVLLGLFLNIKLAFWVALGIPVSITGALWLMGPFNYSINDITLFGMILVLGILVDDAVVVGESVHEARQRYPNDLKKAAETGTNAVSVATVFGVFTTIAAFSPMLWIENELARVLAGFSAVVILALLFSMIESKLILPAHLAYESRKKAILLPRTLFIFQQWLMAIGIKLRHYCLSGLDWFSATIYQPILHFTLHNRIPVLLLFTSFMIFAYGLWDNGAIRSVFFPEIPGRFVTANVSMNLDAPLPLTARNAAQLETALNQVNRAFKTQYELQRPPVKRQLVALESALKVELVAELSTEALRKIPATDFIQAWKKATGQLEGIYSIQFSASDELAGGTAITVSAADRQFARQVAQQVKQALNTYPGVNDVFDDSQGGQRQLHVRVNDYGRQLGVTQSQLAILIGGSYGGLEVQRLLHNGEESRLLIRLPQALRKTQQQLLMTPVHLTKHHFVVLGEVADLEFKREPAVIYRRNRDEVVTIYWRQDRRIMAPEAVWQQLKETTVSQLVQQFPGVNIQATGEFDEINTVQHGFKKALLLTLLLIYVLLAIPLKSYWQPFVIMSVIPFGYAGAVLGHGIMGLPISLLSVFGMMAMTGIVINDSLVLMTRFNDLIRVGMPVKRALIEAGKSRMRAIFLTTITTVCGLLPLLLETSEQAQYLKPAAVSLIFGELFATPVTLILLPLLLALGQYKKAEVVVSSDPITLNKACTNDNKIDVIRQRPANETA
ncbi:efflux RND transporter permease subunit [Spartinivicinus poritis]|uniref:Efflux RND transporter permease subunit n=1 Tax=Spartinivicinus poritis TaxID=2994640 RepID=A0ABT5UHE2_9GAMM|nr:efflux RND transporter permease subunit [Spartinivicinus sp. A2-2]MDE1465406.1 efflux RND transporter permease subunit [Spartinivicinus sp. A2-2]